MPPEQNQAKFNDPHKDQPNRSSPKIKKPFIQALRPGQFRRRKIYMLDSKSEIKSISTNRAQIKSTTTTSQHILRL